MVLLKSVVEISARPMPHTFAELGANSSGIGIMAISGDPIRSDAGHRLGRSKECSGGSKVTRVYRLAVTEAPIDALSLAAIDGRRADTHYLATGGGIGPGTVSALQGAMRVIVDALDALLVAATDANRAGDRYPERLSEIAAEAGIAVERLRPIGATDWNDILRSRAGNVRTRPADSSS